MAQREPRERPFPTAEEAQRYLHEQGQEPAIPPELLPRLERLLEERHVLFQQLAALAPTNPARVALQQRLHAISREQNRLLQELERLYPPGEDSVP